MLWYYTLLAFYKLLRVKLAKFVVIKLKIKVFVFVEKSLVLFTLGYAYLLNDIYEWLDVCALHIKLLKVGNTSSVGGALQ